MAQDLARKIVMIKEEKISLEEIQAYQKKLNIDEMTLNNHNIKLPPNSTIIYDDGKLIKYSDGTMAVIGIASPFIIEDKWTKSK